MNVGNGNSNGASAGGCGSSSSKYVKVVCMIYRQGLFGRTDFSENFVWCFHFRIQGWTRQP